MRQVSTSTEALGGGAFLAMLLRQLLYRRCLGQVEGLVDR